MNRVSFFDSTQFVVGGDEVATSERKRAYVGSQLGQEGRIAQTEGLPVGRRAGCES